jgi:predicted secreted protein
MQGTSRQVLLDRLADDRSKRVIFLSHCLLNENTRYLGGACRAACVREVVEQCMERELGIVQMPCPEQQAWGGVLKRTMLRAYGMRGTLLDRLRPLLLWAFIFYTKLVYRRQARQVAKQIHDYSRSGFTVVGVVGIDGSPSCGVTVTIDMRRSLDALAAIDVRTITVDHMNAIVRASVRRGRGFYTAALQRALARRGISVSYSAYSLLEELSMNEQALQRKCPLACLSVQPIS